MIQLTETYAEKLYQLISVFDGLPKAAIMEYAVDTLRFPKRSAERMISLLLARNYLLFDENLGWLFPYTVVCQKEIKTRNELRKQGKSPDVKICSASHRWRILSALKAYQHLCGEGGMIEKAKYPFDYILTDGQAVYRLIDFLEDGQMKLRFNNEEERQRKVEVIPVILLPESKRESLQWAFLNDPTLIPHQEKYLVAAAAFDGNKITEFVLKEGKNA